MNSAKDVFTGRLNIRRPPLHLLHRQMCSFVTVLGVCTLVLGLLTPAHAAQLTLNWSDASSNEDGFHVERKTGTGGTYATIATPTAGATSYVDGTVTAGTTYCYRVHAYNTAGDSSYSNEACAAAATPILYSVTATKAGTGTGIVASSPSGLNCGSTCSASFASGTSVGLSATPAAGSIFTGWSGACSGTGGCAFVVNAAKSVTASFSLAAQPVTVNLSANLASPRPVGTSTIFTATATGGTAPYQHKWWVEKDGTWTIGQTWSTSNTFAWTPATPGSYHIQVWTRSSGMTADAGQGYKTLVYTVTGNGLTPLTVTSVTASAANPQPAGTPITFTARALGGSTPYQYKWWVYDWTTWTLARNWATGSTFSWTPPSPGNYLIQVWARNSGTSTDTWEAYGQVAYTVTGNGLTVTRVTASAANPQPVGTPITFTATAQGGSAPYQYKWWVYNGSTWTVVRNWTTRTTYRWTPAAPGNYVIQVWARNSGTATDTWEAYGQVERTVR
jgi:Divergent InlB B-repeat domain